VWCVAVYCLCCQLLLKQDDFYLRHLIKNDLLSPVMDVFFANGDRYNLLNSAVLEMVEFIRKENLKVRRKGGRTEGRKRH
jgi:protein phosphatase-4 regulatory subunit 3